MTGSDSAQSAPNPYRGETALTVEGIDYILRPSFAALVAAEDELGPLFALVERAGEGQLTLSEMSTLFWHCLAPNLAPGHTLTRNQMNEAITQMGLAACAKPLRSLLGQILKGTI